MTLYEAGGQAGGRCRSYVDAKLGCIIDNGNHLLLSGNRAVMRYLDEIGAGKRARRSCFGPIFRSSTCALANDGVCVPIAGRCPGGYSTRDGACPIPVPGATLERCRFAIAGPRRTVRDLVGDGGVLFERFWEPLAVGGIETRRRAPERRACCGPYCARPSSGARRPVGRG